jgi:tellurite resistance protein
MNNSRLENFPVSFFSMIMGLAGFSIVWQKAGHVLDLPSIAGQILAPVTCVFFLILLSFYTLKLIRYRKAVITELHNPIKLNFFPAISISLLLISIALISLHTQLAQIIWMIGVALHFVITLYVMRVWIHHEQFEINHINPAWFIPVVGNVLIPITGTHFGYVELSWFFFSIGMVFWIVLFTIIFYRILFHQPLPGKLLPTLFILIAPPAVGFLSYTALTGGVDAFARVLYYIALFLTILLLTQADYFKRIPFFLSWWAYSFPLAAITISTMKMYQLTHADGFFYMSWGFLGLISLVVIYLLFKTAKAIQCHCICTPEA